MTEGEVLIEEEDIKRDLREIIKNGCNDESKCIRTLAMSVWFSINLIDELRNDIKWIKRLMYLLFTIVTATTVIKVVV